MKSSVLLWLTVLLPVTVSCKRASQGGHGEEPHAEHEEAGGHTDAGEGAGGLVRVDPSMLRDLRITVAPAGSRPGGQGVTALGELAVNQDAYAEVASPLSARVVSLAVEAGQTVEARQPLAELQSPELGKARAELRAARARARAARAAAERKRQLGEERIVAAREVQAAEAEAVAAEADVAAARATLAALGAESSEGPSPRDVSSLTLRSPIAGVVLERNAVVGQVADPAQPLFKVGDLSLLWLTVHAFERDAVRVRPGADAHVGLAALPGQPFHAKVTWVGAQVDPSSRTVPVRLELENPEGVLKPGMSASAFIPLGEYAEEVVTVPAAALQQLGDGWSVFVPTQEPGVFEQRRVGRGRTFDGDVEVVQGLAAGEQVVVEGAFLLKAEAEKARGGAGDPHVH